LEVRVNGAADQAMDQLFDLAVILGGIMNGRLAGHGLTPARAEVLRVLHRTGPRTQRELSQILKCTPRNITGLVDALQTAGFVERAPHPADRRAIVVSLSGLGQSLIASWGAERTQGTMQLLGDTSADELAVFSTVLDRVLVRLRAAYPAG
jgi:DNA-binding MarR family transcriptional regulator